MSRKLYVGNLGYQVSEADLEGVFSNCGQVRSVLIMMDRDTGRSRGFGFVEMADEQAANTAIQALNDQEMDGRRLVVNEARPRPERPARSGASDGFRGGR